MIDVVTELKQFCILALNTDDPDKELSMLEHKFGHRSVKKLVGSYKGDVENSYLIVIPTNPEIGIPRLDHIVQLAREHNQQSVLCVNQHREVSLYFVNIDETKPLDGTFRPVSQYEAVRYDSWTYDPENRQYWIVG